jgi:hypothetical protein
MFLEAKNDFIFSEVTKLIHADELCHLCESAAAIALLKN